MSFPLFVMWLWVILPVQLLQDIQKLDHEWIMLAHAAYEEADANNIDPEKFIHLIACESRFKTDAEGDYRKETREYMAYGLLQWWRTSWRYYTIKYGFKGDYYSPADQIHLAVLVISKEKRGIRNWYNCGRASGFF